MTAIAARGWKRFRRAQLVAAARRHRHLREKRYLTLTMAVHAVRAAIRAKAVAVAKAARQARRAS